LVEGIIRPARQDDAEALHRHCYPDNDLEDVSDYLDWCLRQAQKGRIVRLVAEVEGQAVGNAQLTVWGQEGELGSLVVGREYQRRGLARQLLTELIAEARRRGLAALKISVCEGQPAILDFYQRLGFGTTEEVEEQEKKSGLSHPVRPRSIVQLRMLL
jgi:ribosomal protein S18 acetylase RimI-like enzyme